MSSQSEPRILELEQVRFSYDRGKDFIGGLSLSVGVGEFIGLLGANGSGKSTIMKLGSGILRPLSGTVSLWGRQIQSVNNRDRAKLISYLPQTLDISVPFTVRELVSMGLYPYDIPPAMGIGEALEMAGLSSKADAYLTDLSGGERRRTFIAMTLVQGTGLILLDEPLANLDIKYQIELVKLLKSLRERRNIAVMMALHDINMALQFDRVVVVKNGGIIGSGDPGTVLSRALLREAFDVDIEVKKDESENTYLSFEKNF